MTKIVVFASGEGTNAENLIKYFQTKNTCKVVAVVYNRKDAHVAKRAQSLGIETVYVPKADFDDSKLVLGTLKKFDAQLIVLAGFLLLVPIYLIEAFPDRIINIHPALLPKHCGKGMYGMRVHEDVVLSGDKETGITIHLIDSNFDKGKTLFTARCKVDANDNAEEVFQKVHKLELEFFPKVVEAYAKELNKDFNINII